MINLCDFKETKNIHFGTLKQINSNLDCLEYSFRLEHQCGIIDVKNLTNPNVKQMSVCSYSVDDFVNFITGYFPHSDEREALIKAIKSVQNDPNIEIPKLENKEANSEDVKYEFVREGLKQIKELKKENNTNYKSLEGDIKHNRMLINELKTSYEKNVRQGEKYKQAILFCVALWLACYLLVLFKTFFVK